MRVNHALRPWPLCILSSGHDTHDAGDRLKGMTKSWKHFVWSWNPTGMLSIPYDGREFRCDDIRFRGPMWQNINSS